MTVVNEEQATDLESKLREKEQLVGVLTQRLEQAAEQLDRVRRTGGDRPGRGGGSMPVEFIEQQAKTLEELQLAVERFEAAESAEKLGRIEMRVTEIRDMLVSGGATISPGSGAPADNGSANEDAKAAWESMKARLMGDGDGDSEEPSEPDSPPDSNGQSESVAPTMVAPTPAPPVEEVDPVDPPKEIDVDSADADTLRAAVRERDEYVAHLLARLRVAETRTHQPINWEALAECPEDLRERLEEMESNLEDALRRAEVELSLERARLSRVESELEHRGERLEKELVKLGIDDESLDKQNDEAAEKGPRWMRILGLDKDGK